MEESHLVQLARTRYFLDYFDIEIKPENYDLCVSIISLVQVLCNINYKFEINKSIQCKELQDNLLILYKNPGKYIYTKSPNKKIIYAVQSTKKLITKCTEHDISFYDATILLAVVKEIFWRPEFENDDITDFIFKYYSEQFIYLDIIQNCLHEYLSEESKKIQANKEST